MTYIAAILRWWYEHVINRKPRIVVPDGISPDEAAERLEALAEWRQDAERRLRDLRNEYILITGREPGERR